MTRPLFPMPPGGDPPGAHAGLLGHHVSMPGPPFLARFAVAKGASTTNIVVIWTSIVPISGWTNSLKTFTKRCLGILSLFGTTAVVAVTPPTSWMIWLAGGEGVSVKLPIDTCGVVVAGLS